MKELLGRILEGEVPGAPARPGQHVAITRLSIDDTFEASFLGREGTVRGLLYDSPEQYPADPLVLVAVEGVGEDLFFLEELGLASLVEPASLEGWRARLRGEQERFETSWPALELGA